MQRLFFFVFLLILTSPAAARQEKRVPGQYPETISVATHHEIQVAGAKIPYTARVGFMPMVDDSGRHKADLFFISYTRSDQKSSSSRPITFSFNGGPGSSSVWLHLGALGPRRVKMADEGWPLPPPFHLEDNPATWLDWSDLVFIDPVGTGYSRVVSGEDPKQFYGVKEDARWVAEFIRLYLTRFNRWDSPKFLIGESYGTTRAATLSDYLQSELGIYLNGIFLISAILNFETARFTPGNDLPYVTFLPTFTATAWYHGQLQDFSNQTLTEVLKQVEKWAVDTYLPALFRGADISLEEREEIIRDLARFTGLSEKYVADANLRISMRRFAKELLRRQHRTVGRLDSRFKGTEADWTAESYEYDPSYAAIQGPYTAALNSYLRTELRWENDRPYEILTSKVRPWKWLEDYGHGFVNVAEDLRKALNKNPYLQVFIACGYYDLATPYFAIQYTINQLDMDPTIRGHIQLHFYEAGHMMYIHKPSLLKLKQDALKFVRSILSSGKSTQ